VASVPVAVAYLVLVRCSVFVTKFLIPPIVVVIAWLIAIAAVGSGQVAFLAVHFPLEITLCASLLGCIYVAVRLFPQRSDRRLRLTLLLNLGGIVAFFAFMIIFRFVARETSTQALQLTADRPVTTIEFYERVLDEGKARSRQR
jgi:hypothetical protein